MSAVVFYHLSGDKCHKPQRSEISWRILELLSYKTSKFFYFFWLMSSTCARPRNRLHYLKCSSFSAEQLCSEMQQHCNLKLSDRSTGVCRRGFPVPRSSTLTDKKKMILPEIVILYNSRADKIDTEAPADAPCGLWQRSCATASALAAQDRQKFFSS